MHSPCVVVTEFAEDFGNYCYTWSKTSSFLKGKPWTDQPMCYIPCDPKKCPGMPRQRTNFLWAAANAGEDLCYSYEACGGVDKETNYVTNCNEQGGELLNGQVGCSFAGGLNTHIHTHYCTLNEIMVFSHLHFA